LGNVGTELTLSVLYALQLWDEHLATLEGLHVPAPAALSDGNTVAGEPSFAADMQAPWVGELVAPTPAWETADLFFALRQFLGGTEALGHDLATALTSLFNSTWVAIPAGALVAAEVYRRWARKADRRLYPRIDLPEITAPSGLT
jgi:hypothetical protein